ncbi:MAG TPA: crotonase/enoyl-CoA hydratase family protein [Actinobacteria bacterium]|nr:crotonase/enoyl-CoA hydratase family protein [Actinomycetota bacterium]
MKSIESEVLSVEIEDSIGTVWLDRPEKLNAMNAQFWTDFPRIVEALGENDEVRVLVVAGKGRAFTVGIDLAMFADPALAGSGNDDRSAAAENLNLYRTIKRMQHTMTSLEKCPKPVIAAIHGYCLGGGIDLITACDMRIAASDTTFSVLETRLGMVADVGTVQRLPKIVGAGQAADLLYTGRQINAERSLAIGLINEIHPDVDTLQNAAAELAGEIAANSPMAVQGIKAVLAAGEGRSIAEALDYMAVWNAAFLRSDDLTEGVTAQIEHRNPEFHGR